MSQVYELRKMFIIEENILYKATGVSVNQVLGVSVVSVSRVLYLYHGRDPLLSQDILFPAVFFQ